MHASIYINTIVIKKKISTSKGTGRPLVFFFFFLSIKMTNSLLQPICDVHEQEGGNSNFKYNLGTFKYTWAKGI